MFICESCDSRIYKALHSFKKYYWLLSLTITHWLFHQAYLFWRVNLYYRRCNRAAVQKSHQRRYRNSIRHRARTIPQRFARVLIVKFLSTQPVVIMITIENAVFKDDVIFSFSFLQAVASAKTPLCILQINGYLLYNHL